MNSYPHPCPLSSKERELDSVLAPKGKGVTVRACLPQAGDRENCFPCSIFILRWYARGA